MQNRRALLFFAFAILFGAAAAFTAHRALERQAATAPAPVEIETVPAVIARPTRSGVNESGSYAEAMGSPSPRNDAPSQQTAVTLWVGSATSAPMMRKS